MTLKMGKRSSYVGLQWWLSGRESTCQYSRHQFESLVQDESTCLRTSEALCHSYWACVLQPGSCNCWAHVLQLLKPGLPRAYAPQAESAPQWESCTLQLKSSSRSPQLEKSPSAIKKSPSTVMKVQHSKNKNKNIYANNSI